MPLSKWLPCFYRLTFHFSGRNISTEKNPWSVDEILVFYFLMKILWLSITVDEDTGLKVHFSKTMKILTRNHYKRNNIRKTTHKIFSVITFHSPDLNWVLTHLFLFMMVSWHLSSAILCFDYSVSLFLALMKSVFLWSLSELLSLLLFNPDFPREF